MILSGNFPLLKVIAKLEGTRELRVERTNGNNNLKNNFAVNFATNMSYCH